MQAHLHESKIGGAVVQRELTDKHLIDVWFYQITPLKLPIKSHLDIYLINVFELQIAS